ncbi:Polyadenylate-binding protein RBP47A [Cytospora mali]|uniref:Polyadenylate-binding protein RBP47A n=1 Tax=Cytospora mali TaxID=578113 RepID=A0A194VE43_CYTMA|nr:Polyadenylate-binding protein RBP47A [Valsa mali var. pyri (nom. inval.)]
MVETTSTGQHGHIKAETKNGDVGRRIYLGNLLYRVKPYEIEEMLNVNGFEGQVEGIHISIDAVTGRNPGYCFIDFKAREDAERALVSLAGVMIQDRPVKAGPCQPKGAERRWKSDDYKPTFQRWGDWKGSRAMSRADAQPEQGPYGALGHMDDIKRSENPARVYVGGLGKMMNQEENDKEIRGYFEGFKIVAISKRITPHPDMRSKPGGHHYCFVDFESLEEAHLAISKVNGKGVSGCGRLRLQMAGPLPTLLQ